MHFQFNCITLAMRYQKQKLDSPISLWSIVIVSDKQYRVHIIKLFYYYKFILYKIILLLIYIYIYIYQTRKNKKK